MPIADLRIATQAQQRRAVAEASQEGGAKPGELRSGYLTHRREPSEGLPDYCICVYIVYILLIPKYIVHIYFCLTPFVCEYNIMLERTESIGSFLSILVL